MKRKIYFPRTWNLQLGKFNAGLTSPKMVSFRSILNYLFLTIASAVRSARQLTASTNLVAEQVSPGVESQDWSIRRVSLLFASPGRNSTTDVRRWENLLAEGRDSDARVSKKRWSRNRSRGTISVRFFAKRSFIFHGSKEIQKEITRQLLIRNSYLRIPADSRNGSLNTCFRD